MNQTVCQERYKRSTVEAEDTCSYTQL